MSKFRQKMAVLGGISRSASIFSVYGVLYCYHKILPVMVSPNILQAKHQITPLPPPHMLPWPTRSMFILGLQISF